MGQLISIKCDNCAYFRRLQIGQGMLDHRIGNVAEAFDDEAKEQVLKAAECGLFWDFRRRPGFCVCCREYYSIPVFTSSAIPGGCLIGNCPKGHKASDIRMVEEEMPGHLSCPVCGSEAVISTEGLWD